MNSIPEFLKKSVECNPKKTAIITQDQKYSYEEIDQMSSSVAQNLSNYPKNSVVSMMLENSIEFVITYLGILKSANNAHIIPPNISETNLSDQIASAKPKCVISSKQYLIKLDEPNGIELPTKGFDCEDNGYQPSSKDGSNIHVIVKKDSKRLQLLTPFPSWDGENILGAKLLIKTKGKCTTDHISMAGPWLRYRGHLDNISNNCLIGAVNFFGEKTNSVVNQITKKIDEVPNVARFYKSHNIPSVVVGGHNYGEGSSREHAAMEPRHLGVRVVLVCFRLF